MVEPVGGGDEVDKVRWRFAVKSPRRDVDGFIRIAEPVGRDFGFQLAGPTDGQPQLLIFAGQERVRGIGPTPVLVAYVAGSDERFVWGLAPEGIKRQGPWESTLLGEEADLELAVEALFAAAEQRLSKGQVRSVRRPNLTPDDLPPLASGVELIQRLAQLKLEADELSDEDARQVESQLRVLDATLKSPRPNTRILEETLGELTAILVPDPGGELAEALEAAGIDPGELPEKVNELGSTFGELGGDDPDADGEIGQELGRELEAIDFASAYLDEIVHSGTDGEVAERRKMMADRFSETYAEEMAKRAAEASGGELAEVRRYELSKDARADAACKAVGEIVGPALKAGMTGLGAFMAIALSTGALGVAALVSLSVVAAVTFFVWNDGEGEE